MAGLAAEVETRNRGALGIALLFYLFAAHPESGDLFQMVFHPAHFHHGLKIGAAALLSMWAGIGAGHFSHDPEWVREKWRRKSEVEGIEVINSGGQWFHSGVGFMTVFQGRLVPMLPPTTQERIGPSLSKEVLSMIYEDHKQPEVSSTTEG